MEELLQIPLLDVRKLISAGAGDAALVYLYLRSGGTLSQADLRQAQALLLEDSSTQGAARRAGDLDGDGLLTTQDLVLLSQRLEP